ncbi:hypothetical protein ACFWUP_18890 [Nocardia sp. NPDC058658]
MSHRAIAGRRIGHTPVLAWVQQDHIGMTVAVATRSALGGAS